MVRLVVWDAIAPILTSLATGALARHVAKSSAGINCAILVLDCDVKSWWRHQMETFSALLALCAGNSIVTLNSPHKGQWHRADWEGDMFSLAFNDSVIYTDGYVI